METNSLKTKSIYKILRKLKVKINWNKKNRKKKKKKRNI